MKSGVALAAAYWRLQLKDGMRVGEAFVSTAQVHGAEAASKVVDRLIDELSPVDWRDAGTVGRGLQKVIAKPERSR